MVESTVSWFYGSFNEITLVKDRQVFEGFIYLL